MLKGERTPEILDVPMKEKNWTPVDAFVIEYGYKAGKTFTYQPGSGEATMKTGAFMDLDELRGLIKSIEHHELQISVEGTIFVFMPDEPGEEAEAPQDEPETEEHRAPTPEEIEVMNLEDEEIAEAIEPGQEEPPENIEIEEKPPEEAQVIPE